VGLAWTGTRLFGADAGTAAGLVLAALFAAAFEGRIAKTDAVLLACCVAAQGALAQIYVASRRNEPVAGWLPWLFWAAQGLGILVKGPIAPLLSALTVATLFAFERDGRWLKRLKAGAASCSPPSSCCPAGADHLEERRRLLAGGRGQGHAGQGGAGRGIAWPAAGLLRAHLFAVHVAVRAGGDRAALVALNHVRKDARLRFCLAWYIPFWLLFELIPTKLPHYVLPAYPALALLLGWLLAAPPGAADEKLKRWQALLWWATAFGLAAVTLGLAAICIGAPLYLTHAFNFWSIPAAVAVLAAGWLAFPRPAPLSVSRIGAAAPAAGIGYALLFAPSPRRCGRSG